MQTEQQLVQTQQWPLTAADTSRLLNHHDAARRRPKTPSWKELRFSAGAGAHLALRELIFRGAYRIRLEPGRWWSKKVTLIPQPPPVLPAWLGSYDAGLRPWAPAEVKDVIRKAGSSLGTGWADELADRGLISVHEWKKLGLPATMWARTPSGDAWAATAAQHLQRLESLTVEMESDPQSAARAVALAGALALLVPGALVPLARLRGRLRSYGGDLDMDFVYLTGAGLGYDAGFDPFEGVGNFFDSTDLAIESLDRLDTALTETLYEGGGGGYTGGGGVGGV